MRFPDHLKQERDQLQTKKNMKATICRNWAFVPSTKATDANRHLYTHFFQAPLAQAVSMAKKEFEALYPSAEPLVVPTMSGLDDRPSS